MSRLYHIERSIVSRSIRRMKKEREDEPSTAHVSNHPASQRQLRDQASGNAEVSVEDNMSEGKKGIEK